jgi:hypothetical protein
MSDARKWVASKLEGDGYTTTNVGAGGLLIRRVLLPDARVLCIGLGDDKTFGPDDVDAAIEAMPDLQFIAVAPTRIRHGAYQRAEERNICVGVLAN